MNSMNNFEQSGRELGRPADDRRRVLLPARQPAGGAGGGHMTRAGAGPGPRGEGRNNRAQWLRAGA